MATTFTKKIQPNNGNWTVSIGIASKDPNDVTFAQKYGDIIIDMRGKLLTDPDDETFTFTVPNGDMITGAYYSDILLSKLPNREYIYTFDDASVAAPTRYRQAVLYATALQTALHDAIVALRAMTETTPVDTTFTV